MDPGVLRHLWTLCGLDAVHPESESLVRIDPHTPAIRTCAKRVAHPKDLLRRPRRRPGHLDPGLHGEVVHEGAHGSAGQVRAISWGTDVGIAAQLERPAVACG